MSNNEWDPEYFSKLYVAPEDMNDFADFIVETVMGVAKDSKEELIRNGPRDLEPRMLYMSDREPGMNQIVMSSFTDVVPAPVGVGLAMRVARESFGPPSFVCFISEGYMKIFDPDDPRPHEFQRGDITADPTHQECVTISVHHRKPDGSIRIVHLVQAFHYEEGGIVWDQEHRLDSDIDGGSMRGAINEAINASFYMQSN